jgi:hypothetical protein
LLTIFIGYDEKQKEAYEVCKQSIKDAAKNPIPAYKLWHKELREKGLFRREWQTDGATGNNLDIYDGKFFSTQFAHTRFLTASYAKYLGINLKESPYALFVDSDFVFIRDPEEIIADAKKENKNDCPLYVVKHNYTGKTSSKMDGQVQTSYPMKLWSSLMLLDLRHPKCGPTAEEVNKQSGAWLHQFEWLKKDEIGSIPEVWNYIPEHSSKRIKPHLAKAIHYTEGTPDMTGYETSHLAEIYKGVKRKVLQSRLREDS